MEMSGQLCPDRFTLSETSSRAARTRGWVASRMLLGTVEKRELPGKEPQFFGRLGRVPD